ncbi:MAG: Gfo/Idh/MocA family protein [Streptosporangiaceae bacterium]
MSEPVRVGLVGCGTLSDAYAQGASGFPAFQLVACADKAPARARATAECYGIRAYTTIDTLFSDPDVELILNLTPPSAHAAVVCTALDAGKHVYTEPPLAASPTEARGVLDLARTRGLRVGVAPDTFLGRAVQTARALVDAGAIGEPRAAAGFMTTAGSEGRPDGDSPHNPWAPVLHTATHGVSVLVALLGPVRRIAGAARQSRDTPTHVTATLEFVAGPLATLVMSADIPASATPRGVEVYGSQGTLHLPEPGTFDGPVHIWTCETGMWLEAARLPGAGPQTPGLGLADMAAGLRAGRPHRADGALAFHVLEATCGMAEAARSGRYLTLASTCERPAPLRTTLR